MFKISVEITSYIYLKDLFLEQIDTGFHNSSLEMMIIHSEDNFYEHTATATLFGPTLPY